MLRLSHVDHHAVPTPRSHSDMAEAKLQRSRRARSWVDDCGVNTVADCYYLCGIEVMGADELAEEELVG